MSWGQIFPQLKTVTEVEVEVPNTMTIQGYIALLGSRHTFYCLTDVSNSEFQI